MSAPDRGGENRPLFQPLQKQFADALLAALEKDGLSQADLARRMGLSAKHVNHMVHGTAGSFGIYDFAALVLEREWTVELRERVFSHPETTDQP